MLFDGKHFGYYAEGQVLFFKPVNGNDLHVMYVPIDIDSHLLAQSLNDAANAVLTPLRAMSEYKF